MRGRAMTPAPPFWDAWDLLKTLHLLIDDTKEDVLLDSRQLHNAVGESKLQPVGCKPTRICSQEVALWETACRAPSLAWRVSR